MKLFWSYRLASDTVHVGRITRSLKARRPNVCIRENRSLGITLPEVMPPVAAYVPFVCTGRHVLLSGHIAKKDDKPWDGQLGRGLSTEGARAARGVAIDLMATLHVAAGDLNRIKRLVELS